MEIIGELSCQNQKDSPSLEEKDEGHFLENQPSLKKIHREAARKAEAKVISKALEMKNYNRKKASELLNIRHKSLLCKIKECGISKRKNSENS